MTKGIKILSKDGNTEEHKTPPDGGWGWVVVFGSLIINIMVDGIGFTYGVLLPKFAEEFQESRTKVSLVGSVMIGTYLCSGPIAGGLINRFGCRVVTIGGSIVSAIGVVLGAVSPTLYILIVTYGVIGGFGFGMMYLPAIVSVGLYFDKRRPIATGIAVCGSGLGTFIFPPLIEFLTELYDWRGVLVIIAGIILNGAVCGMLIRPVESQSPQKMAKSNRFDNKLIPTSKKKYSNYSKGYCNNRNKDFPREHYMEENQPFVERVPMNEMVQHSKLKSLSLNDMHNLNKCSNPSSIRSEKKEELHTPQQFLSLPTLLFSGKEENIVEYTSQKYSNPICRRLLIVCEYFDLQLFLNVSFVLIFIGNIFLASGFVIPFMYLVDRALLLGISSSKAAFLLSVVGIMNTIGRVLSGLLANLKKVNALLVHNIAVLVASFAVFLQPFCTTYSLLVVFSMVFGICIASHACLSSIILCDLLGVNRLASAFGLLGVARAVFTVLGPLFAGMVFQATGNYDASFWFGGGMFLISAVLHFMVFLPHIKTNSEKRRNGITVEIDDTTHI